MVSYKILKRIINKQIVDYLGKKNELPSPHQHEFREKWSCLHNYWNSKNIKDALDLQILVDCIYPNCQKALDTLPHKRLLTKLKAYGLIENTKNSPRKNLLTNRTQKVFVQNLKTDWLHICIRVIYGSLI